MKTEQIREFVKNKKNILIILIGVLGVLLLFLSEMPGLSSAEKERKDTNSSSVTQIQGEIEKKLEKLLSAVDGTGSVLVMVTLESDGVQTYAVDFSKKENADERTTEVSYEEAHVIVKNGSVEQGLPIKTALPEIRGVAVVCEGGGNAQVKREVTEAVSAALGIGREKIYVAKMKQTK